LEKLSSRACSRQGKKKTKKKKCFVPFVKGIDDLVQHQALFSLRIFLDFWYRSTFVVI